jgi:hypothetical protein
MNPYPDLDLQDPGFDPDVHTYIYERYLRPHYTPGVRQMGTRSVYFVADGESAARVLRGLQDVTDVCLHPARGGYHLEVFQGGHTNLNLLRAQ